MEPSRFEPLTLICHEDHPYSYHLFCNCFRRLARGDKKIKIAELTLYFYLLINVLIKNLEILIGNFIALMNGKKR